MGTQPVPQREPLDAAIIELQIEGIREAAKRARVAFLAAMTASLCVIIVEYNTYFSWYFWRNALTPGSEELRKIWLENHVITVSLLGIRMGEGDLAVVGSLVLFAFSVWLFVNMRTYNNLIESLLAETRAEAANVRMLVYYGISSFLVFSTKIWPDKEHQSERPGKRLKLGECAVTVLYLLPVIAMSFVLVTDLLSLSVLPPLFAPDPHKSLWSQLNHGLQVTAVVFMCIGAMLLIPVAYLCRKIISSDRSSGSTIRKYGDQLMNSQTSR